MNPKGNITFKNVQFEYPSRPTCKVLKNVSFEVKAGETIALVGHSGSGKSSCIALLNRLYECSSGQILIDGVDIKKLNIRHLRSIIGNVEQFPVLFSSSIYDNIGLGNKRISQQQIEWACKVAHAHEFIEKLEHVSL
jgi:ABC-type multidrug transport system fused ATPase/permease subunit